MPELLNSEQGRQSYTIGSSHRRLYTRIVVRLRPVIYFVKIVLITAILVA